MRDVGFLFFNLDSTGAGKSEGLWNVMKVRIHQLI
jgi:hypothetical protein